MCVYAACTVSLGTGGGAEGWLTDYLSRSRLEGSRQIVSLSLPLSLSLFLPLWSIPFFPQSLTGLLSSAPLKVTATLQKFGRCMIPGAQG